MDSEYSLAISSRLEGETLTVDIRPEAPSQIEIELPGGGTPGRVVLNDGV
jgi:hypothetical protein